MKHFILKFALILFLCFGCLETGQDSHTKNTNAFFDLDVFTTANGHEVWLVHEPTIPILSLKLSWPDGHYFDPDETYGASDFVTYMMNEGAGTLSSQDFSTEIETLNMSFGCSGRALWTDCSITLLTERLEPSLDLVRLALTSPRFDQSPIARKKREDLASIERRETNAGYLASDAFKAVYYPNHPLARELTPELLETIDGSIIRARYKRIFGTKGVKISAVGDISRSEIEPIIDALLEGLGGDKTKGDRPDIEPINLNPTGQADPIVRALPQPQSLVQAMAPGLRRDNPQFYAAILANQILGGSATSRLFESLRTDKGLTYGVYSNLSQNDLWASWSLSGQVRNEKAAEFVDAAKEELRLISTDGATQAELDAAKAYLIGAYPLGFDSNAKISSALTSAMTQGLSPDYFNQRNKLLSAVTLEEVNAVAAEYLPPDRFSFVVVGEPEGLTESQ